MGSGLFNDPFAYTNPTLTSSSTSTLDHTRSSLTSPLRRRACITRHPVLSFTRVPSRVMWKDALRLHVSCAVAFACLYYTQDRFTTTYPQLSQRLRFVHRADNVEQRSNTFLYYIWFSCLTQSTVGYTGLLDETTGRIMPFSKINSNLYIALNVMQMLCVLALSGVLFQKAIDRKRLTVDA